MAGAIHLIEPALGIFRIVQSQGVFGELKRVLCVEHHRKFFRACGVPAGHDRSRMGAVRNATRVQRDGTALNSAPRTKVPAHVKQNFVSLDVVVHPWNSHGLDRKSTRLTPVTN